MDFPRFSNNFNKSFPPLKKKFINSSVQGEWVSNWFSKFNKYLAFYFLLSVFMKILVNYLLLQTNKGYSWRKRNIKFREWIIKFVLLYHVKYALKQRNRDMHFFLEIETGKFYVMNWLLGIGQMFCFMLNSSCLMTRATRICISFT
jgi:hypothetical protein